MLGELRQKRAQIEEAHRSPPTFVARTRQAAWSPASVEGVGCQRATKARSSTGQQEQAERAAIPIIGVFSRPLQA